MRLKIYLGGFVALLLGLIAALAWWFVSTPAETGIGPLLTGKRLLTEEILAALILITVFVSLVVMIAHNEAKESDKNWFTRTANGLSIAAVSILFFPTFFIVAAPATWEHHTITVNGTGFGHSRYSYEDNNPTVSVYNSTDTPVTVCVGQNGSCYDPRQWSYTFSYTIAGHHRLGFPLHKPAFEIPITVSGRPAGNTIVDIERKRPDDPMP
jgi:hypothetical protein